MNDNAMNDHDDQGRDGRPPELMIHIDRKPYITTKNPMTGAELRHIAGIALDYDLWEEVTGPYEDINVPDDKQVELRQNMHFYGAFRVETITIIVEGTPHEWPKNEPITYAQVVTLEVPAYAQQSGITYSVTYKNGQGNKPEGVLVPGASVKVKDGMIFNVSETGQS